MITNNTLKTSLILFVLSILVALVSICFVQTASAEEFCIKCEDTTVEVLAAKKNKEDRIFGGYFTEKVVLERSEASDMQSKSAYVKASNATANRLGTNRLDRKIRFTNSGNLKSYSFTNAYWVDQKAFEDFAGDAQSAFDATLFASSKKGYENQMSHRLWNRNARKYTTTVLEGTLGGRAVRVSFIVKDGERVYGLELLEQTVLRAPTTSTQPATRDPEPETEDPTPTEDEGTGHRDPTPVDTGSGTGHRDPTPTESTGTGTGTGHRDTTGGTTTSGDNGNSQTGGDNFTGWTSTPTSSGTGTGHRDATSTSSGTGTGHRDSTGSGTGHR